MTSEYFWKKLFIVMCPPPPPPPPISIVFCAYVMILQITLSNTFPPVVNGSTKLRKVNVAKVGREEGHRFQYLPGESNDTVWPGKYELSASDMICNDAVPCECTIRRNRLYKKPSEVVTPGYLCTITN